MMSRPKWKRRKQSNFDGHADDWLLQFVASFTRLERKQAVTVCSIALVEWPRQRVEFSRQRAWSSLGESWRREWFHRCAGRRNRDWYHSLKKIMWKRTFWMRDNWISKEWTREGFLREQSTMKDRQTRFLLLLLLGPFWSNNLPIWLSKLIERQSPRRKGRRICVHFDELKEISRHSRYNSTPTSNESFQRRTHLDRHRSTMNIGAAAPQMHWSFRVSS